MVRLRAPFVPHSASLGPAEATRVLSAPVPVSAPPPGLDVCFFFISLVSDFLAVRFSVSSGCARRCSVSTYAAILVLRHLFFILSKFKLHRQISLQQHLCFGSALRPLICRSQGSFDPGTVRFPSPGATHGALRRFHWCPAVWL